MKQSADLKRLLTSIDHKSYPAYKDVRGAYDFNTYILSIDHVQGDPFASPSKVSIQVRHAKAGFPAELFDTPWKKTALEDYLLRCFSREIGRLSFKAKGSGKSGLIATSRPGQEVLSRTACEIGRNEITARFEVGFPAFGRTINSGELIRIFFDFLPGCVENVFFYRRQNTAEIKKRITLADDQQFIRNELKRLDLVSFVADGSILPRETGVSDRPMKGSVAFHSPDSLRITLNLPGHGPISGMAIHRGITLIVGGGYHGKSTLLKALESGVYNHIPGDGREYVITDETAVKLRAEDGRSINHVDISLFIRDLPNKKDTTCFSTADASGSTSQAAAVIESIEAGTRAFLIDEDTSATNFMLRDDLMQRIVSRDKEPITPFIERARDLYKQAGISTVLVAGSSGAYFFIADTIIQMDAYRPFDITEMVKNACEQEASKPAIQAPGFKLPTAGRKRLAEQDGLWARWRWILATAAQKLEVNLRKRAKTAVVLDGLAIAAAAPPMQDVLNAVAEDAAKLTEIPTGTRVSKSVSTTNTLSRLPKSRSICASSNSLPTASRPPHSPRWCATAWKKAFWSAAPYRKRLPHS